MADKKIHIIITGDAGNARSVAVRRKTLRNICISCLLLAVCLTAGTLAGINFYRKYSTLASQTETLYVELAQTSTTLSEIRSERDQLELDKATLLENSISRLDEKSQVIQEIMDQIGFKVKVEEDPGHSGGPFIAPDQEYGEQLIHETDRFLEVFRQIPLGRPVPGKISSKYGNRKDPMVKKSAFHPGIDFRGHTGDDIKATADAVVKKASSNKVLGRYIILAHGNGFETIYAHMHKTLVKKGEKVELGQVIGQIGNTGRSTGSHLHYGIRFEGKSIDPMKYLQVASLSLTLNK
jgi:murein DD-endopeptidase MepM/ murein hydrolase activator NlpD